MLWGELISQLASRGVMVNERNVGKLYRQFLALLGGITERTEKRLKEATVEHGGLIWGLDGLQPEGHGTLLYVLYEVLSGTPVGAIQADHPTADEPVELFFDSSQAHLDGNTEGDGEKNTVERIQK